MMRDECTGYHLTVTENLTALMLLNRLQDRADAMSSSRD